MKQSLLFDLDDTLIHCNKYFFRVVEQFVDLMAEWYGECGVARDEIVAKHTEIDIAGVVHVGFQSDHFPQSFVDTHRHFHHATGRPLSPLEERRLWELGNSVYDLEVEPYPHMEVTLESLAREGHTLHLYTGGDAVIQRRKIDQLKLERYFGDRIYVRQHKNTEALEDILAAGGFDRDHTWMIGNSVRTDVVPALRCGIHAVYMKRDEEWTYNVIPIEDKPRGALLTLRMLDEVPPAIERYRSAAAR